MNEPVSIARDRLSRCGHRTVLAAPLYALLLALAGCAPTLETVRLTTDQATLARIAMTAKDPDLACAAVEEVTAPSSLARVAMGGKDAWARVGVPASAGTCRPPEGPVDLLRRSRLGVLWLDTALAGRGAANVRSAHSEGGV